MKINMKNLIKNNLKITIFDKYILKEFIKPYFGALILIVIITNVSELFDRIDWFLKHNVSTGEILIYYLYKSPFVIVQFSPVAALFATVFSLGMLAKNREMIAVITGGVNFFRVVRFLYILGFLLSIFLIFFNDTIVVHAQEKVGEFNRKFKGIPDKKDRQHFPMYGKNNFFYHIAYYHYKTKKMEQVQILKISPDKEKVHFRLDAKYALWNDNIKRWVFYSGIIRFFDNKGNLKSAEEFQERHLNILEKPEDFAYHNQDIDELNIIDAWNYIRSLRLKGFQYQKEMVDFHLKFSFPFCLLLMMLIGAPLSIYSTRSVLIVSFGLALLGSFVYWVLLSVGISLGKNGVLPPFLAVWISNMVFAVISYYVHHKIAT